VSGDQAVGLAYDFVAKQNHSAARSRQLTAMNATPILPGLSPVGAKALTATFDAGRLSSDGGLIVLREAARRLGLAEVITGPLCDARERRRVVHTYADMALARMLMISAGYEDCDDIDALRADPALKLACGRCPESGADLMSQPTLSRLENLAQWRALARVGLC
jgi:Transposase DDE domain group 1